MPESKSYKINFLESFNFAFYEIPLLINIAFKNYGCLITDQC